MDLSTIPNDTIFDKKISMKLKIFCTNHCKRVEEHKITKFFFHKKLSEPYHFEKL